MIKIVRIYDHSDLSEKPPGKKFNMFPHHYLYDRMGSFGGVGMIIGAVIALLFLIGLILLIIWAVRRISGRPQGMGMHMMPPMGGVSPRDIAQMRYAKGEITREEYQALLEDLSK